MLTTLLLLLAIPASAIAGYYLGELGLYLWKTR